jgi:hypothetical protein
MRTNSRILVDNEALVFGATAAYTSDVLDLSHCWAYSTFLKWTKDGGTVGGTIIPYKSADGVNWVAMTTTNLTDGNGSIHTDYSDVAYPFYKVVITLSGGSATIYCASYQKGA